MISKLPYLLYFCVSLCWAQTIDQPLDSIRAPFSTAVTYGATIQLETISAATGKPVLTGTAVKIPSINLITDSVILADLLGNKTVAVTVSGIRATFTATPSVTAGWEQVAPYGARVTFKTPIALPAAQSLGCRYDMPAQTFSIASLTSISWGAAGSGNLKCAVGIKAADLPAPGPVAVGVIPPPPAPTPAPTAESLVGDCIGTLPVGYDCTRLIAPPLVMSGANWTLVAGRPLKDGVDTNPASQTTVSLIRSTNSVRLVASNGVYQCWTGTAWADAGC